MKREDVVPGGEYATDLGEHVRIAPEEVGEDAGTPFPSAGWRVEGGEWAEAEEWGQRLLKEGGYKKYQSNVALRATDVATETKIVIEPRRLMLPWEDHVKALQVANEERDAMEANAQALRMRAEKVKVKARPDMRKQEVRVSFADFDTLLRKAKV